jgi:pimeloyl-ACP methyl ester carboxylesterase
MQKVIVFLPGIMGSELQLGSEVVWPPTVSETVFGYKRIDKLQNPAARATKVISNVSCVDFYAPLQSLFQQLGYTGSGPTRLIEHPYDWRGDLFHLAEGLADHLDTVKADQITIVAHSMGGLVSRLLLETGTYDSRSWFGKISQFIALATPHNGAPLALARVLGLDAALGISAKDFKLLAENEKFPSGYQLLPAPGEAACWNTTPGADIAPLDFYDPKVAAALGMKPALVARAKAVHDALSAGHRPAGVRYFYFCGAGHKTVTRVNITAAKRDVVFTPDAGDGTVPMWSALPAPVQKQVVINEHANVFRGTPFKRVFFRLFGQDAGVPVEAAEAELTINVSLQRQVFRAGEPIELVLSADAPIIGIAGSLTIDRISDTDQVEAPATASVPVLYSGPPLPHLALTLPLPLSPGLYELRFEGDRRQTERAVFAVST